MRSPKYRRHQTGRGFVEFKGVRHYLPGAYNSPESLEAYKAFLRVHVFSEAKAFAAPTGEGVSLNDVIAAYLDYAADHYPAGNRSEYNNCRHALLPLSIARGTTPAVDFGPKALKEYRKGLIASGQSRGYINQQLAKIRRAYKWAASEELIPVAAYQAIATVDGLQAGRTEAIEPPAREPVEWSTLEPVLAEVSPTIRAMLLLQWHTGARAGSVVRATPSQFAPLPGEPSVLLWSPVHKQQHTGAALLLPIGPKCREVIGPLLEKSPDAPLFDPRSARKNARYRRFYSTHTYGRAITRGIDRVNATRKPEEKIPHFSTHQIRHSKGEAIRNVYGLEAAQAILGHGSIDATQLYSERRLGLAIKIAKETG